jgi:hypothetical protein
MIMTMGPRTSTAAMNSGAAFKAEQPYVAGHV